LYDLTNNKIKWTKKIFYQQGSIEQFDNIIIQTNANKSYCLNIENGENQWEVKNTIYYVEPFQKIGIGYKFKTSTGYTNTLEGIDLNNGNTIWKRELNREYSWNNIFHLNDSVIVVAAAGLHSINLKNGTGWDYNTITGKKDYTETALANAAGVALGVLTGAFVMSTGHNLVRDVVSNILIDSSTIYFASKEKISRLDYNGQIKWSSPLPEDLTSSSSIFTKDSLLYMINKGFAFMGYRQLDFGKPFFAGFNRNTGKQLFLSTIGEKKDQITGFKIYHDTVLLVFKDRVSKYSLSDGSFISEKTFDIQTLGELRYFIGGQVYLKTDSIYNNLIFIDSTSHYLFTKTGKILVINDNLDVLNQIDYNQIYLYYLKTKDYKFLAKDNETTVINKGNKKAADFKASNKAILIGSTLYDMQEKSFIEIDLNELINHTPK
jgi:outer membrane protein assembly factor BamB